MDFLLIKRRLANSYYADLRSLALMRVMAGLIFCYDMVTRSFDLEAFYSDFGVMPRGVLLDNFIGTYNFSLFFLSGNQFFTGMIFFFAVLIGLAFTFGYKTRVATILAWLILVSLTNRNPFVINGGDIVLRVLFFWMIFLPIQARYSVDAALTKEKSKENEYFSMSSIALLAQVGMIYLFTVLLKDSPQWRTDFTATYYALELDAFTTQFGHWLSQFYAYLKPATVCVLAIEILGPLALLIPYKDGRFRLLGLLFLIGMHIGFEASMRLGFFPYVDMTILVGCLPKEFWSYLSRLSARIPRSQTMIYYDGNCGFCYKSVLILKELLILDQTEVRKIAESAEVEAVSQTKNSWVVRGPSGRLHTEFTAGCMLLGSVPFLGVVLKRIPFARLRFLGDKVYRKVADNRGQLSKFTAQYMPFSDTRRLHLNLFEKLIVGFSLIMCLAYNLQDKELLDFQIPKPLSLYFNMTRLDQKWDMFAPFPSTEDGFLVVEGQLDDKTIVDVMHLKVSAPDYAPKAHKSELYKNARWRKYIYTIWAKKHKDKRLHFGRYLCRRWMKYMPESNRLQKFQVYFMLERSLPYDQKLKTGLKVEKVNIWNHKCY